MYNVECVNGAHSTPACIARSILFGYFFWLIGMYYVRTEESRENMRIGWKRKTHSLSFSSLFKSDRSLHSFQFKLSPHLFISGSRTNYLWKANDSDITVILHFHYLQHILQTSRVGYRIPGSHQHSSTEVSKKKIAINIYLGYHGSVAYFTS